jgi:hypothetical protein
MVMAWLRGNAVECLMARCRQYRTGINDEYIRSLLEFQIFLIWFPVFPRTYSYLLCFRGGCRYKLQLNCSECRLIPCHTVITRTASSSSCGCSPEIPSLSNDSTSPPNTRHKHFSRYWHVYYQLHHHHALCSVRHVAWSKRSTCWPLRLLFASPDLFAKRSLFQVLLYSVRMP